MHAEATTANMHTRQIGGTVCKNVGQLVCVCVHVCVRAFVNEFVCVICVTCNWCPHNKHYLISKGREVHSPQTSFCFITQTKTAALTHDVMGHCFQEALLQRKSLHHAAVVK